MRNFAGPDRPDGRRNDPPPRWVMVGIGLLFIGMGAMPTLFRLGIVPTPSPPPFWVALLGIVASSAVGVYIIWVALELPGQEYAFSVIWTGVTTALALTFAWVGFGPGERQTQGGVTGSEIEGRGVFGLAAVFLLGPIAGLMWRNLFRLLFRRKEDAGTRT